MDMLYDYFISGAGTVHGNSSSITRLREIETIIRDNSRELDKTETKVLKTVGILNLIGRSGPLRASRRLVEHVVGEGAAHSAPNAGRQDNHNVPGQDRRVPCLARNGHRRVGAP